MIRSTLLLAALALTSVAHAQEEPGTRIWRQAAQSVLSIAGAQAAYRVNNPYAHVLINAAVRTTHAQLDQPTPSVAFEPSPPPAPRNCVERPPRTRHAALAPIYAMCGN